MKMDGTTSALECSASLKRLFLNCHHAMGDAVQHHFILLMTGILKMSLLRPMTFGRLERSSLR